MSYIKEQDLKDMFEELANERLEKDGIEPVSDRVMSRLRWAVGSAYANCLNNAKIEEQKRKSGKKSEPKPEKKPKKETKQKKDAGQPNEGVSLKSMGLIKEMTPEEKAEEAKKKRDALEEEKRLKAAQRLEVIDGENEKRYPDGHPNALVEKCKDCGQANKELNKCRIYEEPRKAWKHKSGRCPGRGLMSAR